VTSGPPAVTESWSAEQSSQIAHHHLLTALLRRPGSQGESRVRAIQSTGGIACATIRKRGLNFNANLNWDMFQVLVPSS
jgi:hypothetical protein